MKIHRVEFGCSACNHWVTANVPVAESAQEYELMKKQTTRPCAEMTNGDFVKPFPCDQIVKGEDCRGRVNVVILRKAY